MQQNISIEESNESVSVKKINKKYTAIIGAISIFIIIGIFAINWFNNKYIYNGKIAENVYIGSVNVSNLTKDKAKELISNKYHPKDIIIKNGDKSFTITSADINLNYDVEDIVKSAYDFNKTNSYFKNVKEVISLQSGNKKTFEIKPTYSEKNLVNNLQEIGKDINTDVSDAKLNISGNGEINVTPAVIGQELDINESEVSIKKSIDDNSFNNIDLVVKKTNPKISTAVLQSVDSLLASHSTTFNNSSPNRAHNIIRSANSTSDIVLMPGEEFSYNKTTGPRSKANGYKDAPVIVNGKVQDGPGGGVCQVSTTIYNSVLNSGLDITKVRNHSLASAYAPMGKDATVAYDYLDLKFKNPYKHPIYIKNTAYNGVVTSNIYGNSTDKQNINIVVEKGNSGSTDVVKTYREFKDSSGNVIKNEYITTSTYKK